MREVERRGARIEREDEDRREAVQFLMRMREAAMTYARWRGWTQLGLYFRFFGCEPEGEEERGIIRLHVVNLARAGPRLRKTSRNNLPIDDVIEALGGLRASRRGSVLLVSPVEGRESVTPRSFESTAAPWVDSKTRRLSRGCDQTSGCSVRAADRKRHNDTRKDTR